MSSKPILYRKFLLEKEMKEKEERKSTLLIKPKLDLNVDQIFSLRKEGMSYRKIGKIVGCSEGTIRKRLKEKE